MRTKKSLKNILSAVILTLVVGLIGFVKVKVFINGLSNDIYSLNQLFGQIFNYLAIADIGFGLLINKQLYQAFAKDDKKEINKIYSTSKKFYKIIGIIMISIALIISFFVQFLTKANLPVFYIQLVFIIFIIRNVIDYFFVAPRYILEADQKIYKVNIALKGIRILESMIEIILVLIGVDYLIILLPSIFITLIIDIYINKKIYKMYPWLTNDKTFNKKYLKGTKDIIWRKGADLLNSNTDIILISTFINPLNVVIYSSYVYITKFIGDLIYLISSGITPSFANALFKEKEEKSIGIFHEINTLFLFAASFINIMLYIFLTGLINFWVGPKYVVNNFTLFLFCFSAFQVIIDKPIVIIINSKGLFKETKIATILEALLNIIISLVLIKPLGLSGVLIGTILAKLFTSFLQNPIYIFKNIFCINPLQYFSKFGVVLLINIIFIFLFNMLNLTFNNILTWIFLVLIYAVIIGIVLFAIFYLCFKSFRKLTYRGVEFIKVKGKYTE